uniref:VWFC domain-containing protein n=1 Tax=Magallana gigas TaxID=29159 RepID=A0A8W8MGP6_MAGGI|nr:brorin isoform X3 [Crassostrea gigas]
MIRLAVLALFLSYAICDSLISLRLSPTPAPGCNYRGTYYPSVWFNPTPCERCQCTTSGEVMCFTFPCLHTLCADPVIEKDQCCPRCPNGYTCKAPDGHIVKAGETYHLNSYTSCQCDTHQWTSFTAVCTYQVLSIP